MTTIVETLSPATDRAVEQLTQSHTEYTDGHMVEWPPLIEWLESSVTEIISRAGSGGGNGIPINEDALLLLDRCRKRSRMMCAALYLTPSGDLIYDVQQAWKTAQAERAGGRMDDRQWESITAEFADWVLRIQAEDTRPRRLEVVAPCPSCGERYVYLEGRDDDGRDVFVLTDPSGTLPRKAAVVVEFSEGRAAVSECRAPDCGQMWAGWDAVYRLGYTLGARQNLEVLKACGIDLDIKIGTL